MALERAGRRSWTSRGSPRWRPRPRRARSRRARGSARRRSVRVRRPRAGSATGRTGIAQSLRTQHGAVRRHRRPGHRRRRSTAGSSRARRSAGAIGPPVLVMNTEREPAREVGRAADAAGASRQRHPARDARRRDRSRGSRPSTSTTSSPSAASATSRARTTAGMRCSSSTSPAHGHRAIGYIGGPPIADLGIERLDGFRAAVARVGLDARAAYVEIADATWSARSGAAAMERLLALDEPPTAVVTSGDTLALGAMSACRGRGAARCRTTWRSSRSTIRAFGDLLDPPRDRAAPERGGDGPARGRAAAACARATAAPAAPAEVRLPVELVDAAVVRMT